MVVKFKESGLSRDLVVDEKIVLKWVLQNWRVTVWIEIEIRGRPLVLQNAREFSTSLMAASFPRMTALHEVT